MTKAETAQILALLHAAYPAFYSKIGKSEIDGIVNLWAEMFAEDDFRVVKYALKHLIAEHTGYPPDIAALKGKIKEIVSAATGKLTHEELWHKLKAAAKNGHYGAEQEFAKLPPVLQRYLGSPSTLRQYAMVDEATFNTVNHGQFLKQIKIIEEREEFAESMPDDVKYLISSMTKKFPEPQPLTEAQVNSRRNQILDTLDGVKRIGN